MILIDNRTGSKELMRHMPKGAADLCHLEYGDASIMGRGPDGTPTPIGIERKAIRDLVNSMVRGRISGHQLPGLLNCYDRVYLVVEGQWRPNPNNGILEVVGSRGGYYPLQFGSQRFMASQIYNYLNTLEVMSGVMVRQTRTLNETAQLILSLHSWWNKDWADHTSHIDVHKGMAAMMPGIHLRRPSLLCRVASELPGIGPKRARDVARHFSTILDMCCAGPDEWEKIPNIGRKTATSVVHAITSGEEDE